MDKMTKGLIGEDVDFIRAYLNTLKDRHPEIIEQDQDILQKFERRLDDISKRVAAE